MTTKPPSAALLRIATNASEYPGGADARVKKESREVVAERATKKLPPEPTDREWADFLLYDEPNHPADYRPIRYRPYDIKTLTNFEKWADSNGELKKPTPKSPRPGSIKKSGPGNAPPVPSTIREGLFKTYGPKRK